MSDERWNPFSIVFKVLYRGLLKHIDENSIRFPTWMCRRLLVLADLFCGSIGCVEVEIAAEQNGALSCEQSSNRRSVAPAFTNTTDAGNEYYFVGEVVKWHDIYNGMLGMLWYANVGWFLEDDNILDRRSAFDVWIISGISISFASGNITASRTIPISHVSRGVELWVDGLTPEHSAEDEYLPSTIIIACTLSVLRRRNHISIDRN